MKNGEFCLVMKKACVIIIFIVALLIFCLTEIFLLHIEVTWQKGILKLLSCLCQIVFSILGVSLLMEHTTLKNISRKSMEEMKTSIVDHTAQVDYIKNNYSKTQRRQLLMLSYMDDIKIKNNFIDEIDKIGLVSFDKIIEKLITSVYYDKDHMTITYDCDGKHIIKKINRFIVVKNLYGSNYEFVARNSFNSINVGEENIDAYKITKLRIDDKVISAEEIKTYVHDCCCENRENSYTNHKILKIPTNKERETTIEYSLELLLPFDDKMSLMTTTLPVKDFSRQIIMHKGKFLKDIDVNVFSLAKSMKVEGERFVCEIESEDKKIKSYKINSSTWLFPGDGCSILLK